MTADQAQQTHQPLPPAGPRWYARRWVQIVGAFIIGAGIGGAGASGSAVNAEQVEAANKRAADAQAAAATAQADAQAAVDAQTTALAKQRAALDAREAKLGGAEAAAKANTFDGDGLYIVGDDIKAGTYKSTGGANCYWARHDKANDILDNHLGGGPTVVVVRSSDFSLEVSGCAPFRRT